MLLILLLKQLLLQLSQPQVITHVGMIGVFIVLPAIGTQGGMQPYSSIKGFFSILPASPRAMALLLCGDTKGHGITLLRTPGVASGDNAACNIVQNCEAPYFNNTTRHFVSNKAVNLTLTNRPFIREPEPLV